MQFEVQSEPELSTGYSNWLWSSHSLRDSLIKGAPAGAAWRSLEKAHRTMKSTRIGR